MTHITQQITDMSSTIHQISQAINDIYTFLQTHILQKLTQTTQSPQTYHQITDKQYALPILTQPPPFTPTLTPLYHSTSTITKSNEKINNDSYYKPYK